MQRYQNALIDPSGNVIAGASVTVLTSTGGAATLYSGNGTGQLPSNVLTTDSQGEFSFYAANGRYTLSVSAPNFVAENYSDFLLYDGLASETSASVSAEAAANSAAAAAASATSAQTAQTGAVSAKTDAETANTSAQSAKTAAQAAQSAAAASATYASESAASASSSFGQAQTAATSASNSATSASSSAASAAASQTVATAGATAVASAVAQAVDGQKQLFVGGTDYTIGTTTQLTLTYAPAKSGTVKVFFDGVYQSLTTWSLAGKVLTFTSAISANRVEVQYEIASQFVGLSTADLAVLGSAQAASQAAQVAAETAKVGAEAAQSAAETARTASQTARDAAYANANVYATVAAGLAAVADGVQFQVVTGDEIVRYTRTNSTTATEVARYPSLAIVIPNTSRINVQARAVSSTVAVNGLLSDGWINTHTLTVYQNTNWGAGTTNRYITDSTYTSDLFPFLRTVKESMDQEVTTFAMRCRVFFRITSTGRAISLSFQGDTGVVQVVGVENISEKGSTTQYFEQQNILSAANALGWNAASTENAKWTFGISGADIYIKFNNQLVYTFKNWGYFYPDPGKLGLSAVGTGPYGFRDTWATVFSDSVVSAKLRSRLIDVTDAGVKSLVSTGSMTAGSSLLTTKNDPGFAVGDTVIVEIGGETGRGLPGTKGVGGTWPSLSYANATAMNAATPAANTIAWLEDTGIVYQYVSGSWVKRTETAIYTYKACPRSLVAQITAIAEIAGANIVTNGDFSSADLTAWQSISSGTYAIVSNALQITSAGSSSGAACTLSTVSGRTYQVSLDLTLGTATSVAVRVSTAASGGSILVPSSVTLSSSGTKTLSFTSTATTHYIQIMPSGTGTTATIDNLNVSLLERGKVLTLSSTASVDTTDAAIYTEASPAVLTQLLGDVRVTTGASPGLDLGPWIPRNMTVRFPAGRYATTGFAFNRERRTGWVLTGEGQGVTTLFSPKGVNSATIAVGSSNVVVRDLTLQGNARRTGYGFNHTSQTAYPGGTAYPYGIYASSVSNVLVTDVEAIDVWQYGVGFSYCTNCWGQNITVTLTDGLFQYIQWMLGVSDSTGGGFRDCVIRSPVMTAALETFRSTGTKFQRIKIYNGGAAVNSSGNWLMEDLEFYLDRESVPMSWSINNPLINVNTNISPAHPDLNLGGVIRRPRVVMYFPLDEFDYNPIAVVINSSNTNVTVEGTYDGTSVYHPDLIAAPNAAVTGSSNRGAVGVVSTATNTIVRNIRVRGKSPRESSGGTGYANIHISGAGGQVINCVADLVVVSGGATVTGTRTNATYGSGP